MDLDKALVLAKEEYKEGLSAIYFLLVNSDFYNCYSKESIEKIKTIQMLGHEIGLHYDNTTTKEDALKFKNTFNIQKLKSTAHEPSQGTYYRMIEYKPRGYKYLSDSGMNWREGCFCQHLDEPKIYLNTHPLWWNDANYDREMCLTNMGRIKNLYTMNKLEEMLNFLENEYLRKFGKK